jgi:hypothetical protein
MEYENRTMHEVLRGSRFGLPEGKQYAGGYALRFDETDYYILKLWFQQERSYYIARLDEKKETYTIFGKRIIEDDNSVRFQNPVGYARETPKRTHLEIVMPDLARRYYMSLFPKQ